MAAEGEPRPRLAKAASRPTRPRDAGAQVRRRAGGVCRARDPARLRLTPHCAGAARATGTREARTPSTRPEPRGRGYPAAGAAQRILIERAPADPPTRQEGLAVRPPLPAVSPGGGEGL
ncbi:hypothetical protein AMYX_24260 [Anaeromyxobacter diazotrophicus]|uniref:Uncharacterized protein n=1 Tax=Anaeromyxobacter diazotrophicus TaxID=2590199 RepID=A0A7I9VMQ4_9BACT|nr:hypothetical protein AMYX_24260 [Anaeromyxobacter diazotrophicus]